MKLCIFGCFDSKFRFLDLLVRDCLKKGHTVNVIDIGSLPICDRNSGSNGQSTSEYHYIITSLLDERVKNRFDRRKTDKGSKNIALNEIYSKLHSGFLETMQFTHEFDAFLTCGGCTTTEQSLIALSKLEDRSLVKVIITSTVLEVVCNDVILIPSLVQMISGDLMNNIVLRAVSRHAVKLIQLHHSLNLMADSATSETDSEDSGELESKQISTSSHQIVYLRQQIDLNDLKTHLFSIISHECLSRNSCWRVALTSGPTTMKCARGVTNYLQNAGFEVVVFDANGIGGPLMSHFIHSGYIKAGLIDMNLSESACKMFAGVQSAGRSRFVSVVKCGMPVILVPGGLDAITFWHRCMPFNRRENACVDLHGHWTLSRTTRNDNAQLGKFVANVADKSRGPLKIVIPESFSSLSEGRMQNKEADNQFTRSLRQNLDTEVEILEFGDNINHPDFATLIGDTLMNMIQTHTAHVSL